MILNEQLIQDMFQEEPSKEVIQLPAQEVSLNFTVSNRSSKNQRTDRQDPNKQHQPYDPLEIINLANSQLTKFNQWLSDSETKFQQNSDSISTLLSELQSSTYQCPTQQDLSIIKNQIFRREMEDLKCQSCKQCISLHQQISELRLLLISSQQEVSKYRGEIEVYKNVQAIKEIKEELISRVEINLLNGEIGQLNNEISILRNEKASLEKTYLFNKTKNSEVQMRMELQKSKGLSAAKNSTNSSEIMNRHHETIVFIDPIESDVDEWIRFFQNQKNRYMNMCKKQEGERMKELGRSFTKDEKTQLYSEGRLFVIFSSIKQIWKNLTKIRQNTNSFLNSQTSKNTLKQKFLNNDSDNGVSKYQSQKISIKNNKLIKVNQYLIRENQNLKDINEHLKQQLFRQNICKNENNEKYLNILLKVQEIHSRLLDCQQQNKLLGISLQTKEQQVDYCLQEIKRYKKLLQNKSIQGYLQLQVKNKEIQKKYFETVNQLKIKDLKLRSIQLRLKKQSLQRKKLYNELQDSKGSFRIYCRIRPKLILQKNEPTYLKSINDRIFLQEDKYIKFDKIYHKEDNSQQKVFEDVKKLVQSVMDGYNLCIICYGHIDSGKTYTLLGNQDQPGIFPRLYREIFKNIEAQKEFINVQMQISCVQLCNDKINDVFKNQKDNGRNIEIQQDEMGNVGLSNATFVVIQSASHFDEHYYSPILKRAVLNNKKGDNESKSHLIISVILEIQNKKTQEKYRSKINLVDLASPQQIINSEGLILKEMTNTNKGLTSLSNSIASLFNKQNYIPYRDNKLTHILKNTLNSQSKLIFIANVAPCQNSKEESISSITYSCRLRGLDRSRKSIQKQQVVKKRSISRLSNI